MFEFEPVREASTYKIPNYEMVDEYLREEVSEISEDEDSNNSEMEDEVP